MAKDNKAFEVVSMKEYLEEEGMKGKLINQVCYVYVRTGIIIYRCDEACV
jgi:hypothetical protein